MTSSSFSLHLIVAMDESRVIGHQGDLPWHISDDLRRFKRLTMGHPIIMGRVTHESIGRALPGRQNIIVTRNTAAHFEGCAVAASVPDAVAIARAAKTGRAYIIGGSQIYAASIDFVEVIEMTRVHAEVTGDAHFPSLSDDEWQVHACERHEPSPNNDHAFSFITLHRTAAKAPHAT